MLTFSEKNKISNNLNKNRSNYIIYLIFNKIFINQGIYNMISSIIIEKILKGD